MKYYNGEFKIFIKKMYLKVALFRKSFGIGNIFPGHAQPPPPPWNLADTKIHENLIHQEYL